jgi:hypothetical protein
MIDTTVLVNMGGEDALKRFWAAYNWYTFLADYLRKSAEAGETIVKLHSHTFIHMGDGSWQDMPDFEEET